LLAARAQTLKAVSFVSCSAGAGTTTAAVEVAEELRRTFNLRVLLVELNVIRPTFIERFGLQLSSPLRTTSHDGPKPNLGMHLLPSGVAVIAAPYPPGAEQPRPGLAQAVARLMPGLASNFDMVLVDAPPVLDHSDVIEIAPAVRHAVLVIEAGRTRLQAAERARRNLGAAGIDIVGSILNKHERRIPTWLYRKVTG
jgi:Mrp family chromosome partitioning ATPase